MIYSVCSVKDIVADQFGMPFYALNPSAAQRSFTNEVNTPAELSVIYKNPDDFQLFELGIFDDNTGKFELNSIPRLICTGSQVKKV